MYHHKTKSINLLKFTNTYLFLPDTYTYLYNIYGSSIIDLTILTLMCNVLDKFNEKIVIQLYI